MYQVLLENEIRNIEDVTLQKQGITMLDLMIRAGKNTYEMHKNNVFNKQKYLIISGRGHNGGDALIFGEEAFKDKNDVTAIIIKDNKQLSTTLLTIIKRYQEQGITIKIIEDIETFNHEVRQFGHIDTIIDGLFGIGLSRNIDGLYEKVISWVNNQKQYNISIDIPSGLHADTGKIMNISVKADITYTIEAYKQGLLINDGLDCSKDIKVVDIGMEKLDYHKYLYHYQYTIPRRKHNSHKYDYKSIITVGGQIGVMGALTLAGKSALVSGAGLSTVATHKAYQDHYVRSIPELMYEVIENREKLSELLHKKDAILFGLGIKELTPFEKMIYDEIIKQDKPLVLDAAGIMLLKNKEKRNNRKTIITPHVGEFAKLMDITVDDILLNPLKHINQCLQTYDCDIVLKGPTTIYATSKQILYLNEGSPALAKAGSGDVLAGMILTYAARDLPIEEAISLHMLAGHLAAKNKHEECVLAQDIIEQIPNVYKKFA